jgi:hypothetical protein
MTGGDVLEIIAALVAALKAFAAKLPAVVHLSVVPQGMKPTEENVETYERAVGRFRSQSQKSPYRKLTDPFIESLEAFETGRLLSAIQPLLLILDHLDQMHRDQEVVLAPDEQKRLGEYRTTLHKILPGKNPELEGAGRGLG